MLVTIGANLRGNRRIGGLVLAAALAAAAATPAAADPSRTGGDPGQPGSRGQVVAVQPQLHLAPVHQAHIGDARSVPVQPARQPALQGRADEAVDQALGQLPIPGLPGGDALASAGAGPVWASTEYFCSDEDGVSLPANKDSVCPEGTMKVSVTTCEAGEECNL